MSTNSHGTLDQRRAAHALKRACAVQSEAWQGEYRAYVDGLPAAIIMNGLGQALATELAAAKGSASSGDAHARLFAALAEWLAEQVEPYSAGTLLNDIMSNAEHHYLHAQAEALAWLSWHKKFCRAYLNKKETPE